MVKLMGYLLVELLELKMEKAMDGLLVLRWVSWLATTMDCLKVLK